MFVEAGEGMPHFFAGHPGMPLAYLTLWQMRFVD